MRTAKLLVLLALLSLLAVAPAAAAGIGETCDGIAAIQCDEGLWCEHPASQCKMSDAAGKCISSGGLHAGLQPGLRLRRRDLWQSMHG